MGILWSLLGTLFFIQIYFSTLCIDLKTKRQEKSEVFFKKSVIYMMFEGLSTYLYLWSKVWFWWLYQLKRFLRFWTFWMMIWNKFLIQLRLPGSLTTRFSKQRRIILYSHFPFGTKSLLISLFILRKVNSNTKIENESNHSA